MSLALALALVALLLAAWALLSAWRTERHVVRLSRALAREWGLATGSDGPEGAARPRGDDDEPVAQLRRSVAALEQQLREQAERLARQGRPAPLAIAGAAAPAPRDAEPRARVVAHLQGLGYEDVVVFEGRDGALLYEAREDGMPRKGAARLAADGQVVLGEPARVRAFP
jgi:hypothetical protein